MFMQVENRLFEQLINKNNITKKEFSDYSKIPYNTVLGWRKKGFVPAYAMVILKDMNYRKKFDEEELKSLSKTAALSTKLTTKEQNRLKSAFWGTNYTIDFIVQEIKKGNKKVIDKIKQNLSFDMKNQILGKLSSV